MGASLTCARRSTFSRSPSTRTFIRQCRATTLLVTLHCWARQSALWRKTTCPNQPRCASLCEQRVLYDAVAGSGGMTPKSGGRNVWLLAALTARACSAGLLFVEQVLPPGGGEHRRTNHKCPLSSHVQ